MDKGNGEVLVHIKAPSKVSDDRKYLAIAQNVLDFEPVSIFKVSDGLVSQNSIHDQPDTNQIAAATSGLCTPNHARPATRNIVGRLVQEVSRGSSYQPSLQGHDIRRTFAISKTSFLSKATDVHVRPINPPFRSPLRDKSRSKMPFGLNSEMNTNHNEIIPTRACTQVLVPNTDAQSRKRAWSDTFCSRSPIVADSCISSQIHTVPGHWNSDPIPQLPASHSEVAGSKEWLPIITVPQIDDKGRDLTKAALVSITRTPMRRRSKQARVSDILTFQNERACCQTSTDRGSHVNQETMISKQPTSTDTESATVTPSLRYQTFDCCDNKPEQEQPVVRSPIDLVTPESSTRSPDSPDEEPRILRVSYDRHVSNLIRSTVTVSSHPSNSNFSPIQELPLTISAPNPTLDQLLAPTHLSPVLQATADGLALPAKFRPQSIARRIAGKERGYWKVPITIVEPVEASRRRQGATRQMGHKNSPHWRPLLKHNHLTVEEFLDVWNELNAFVTSGKASWSVKIIRRTFLVDSNHDVPGARAHFYLQVYCYGEAIPYIYAMLLVCTRMFVLCMPLQWISALDECPIITMTGHETRKGSLGKWTMFRDDGGRESWGVQ